MAAALDPDNSRIDTGTLFSAIWRKMGRIVWVTTGLLLLTLLVLMFVPKMYESSASILVESRSSSFLRASNDAVSNGGSVSDEMAIASQVELIRSRDTLLSVIESENLRAEPELNTAGGGILGVVLALLGPPPQRDTTEVVLTNVRDHLTVIQERDSRIISILYKAEDPELAARVANAIADAHVNRRAGLQISDTADASKWLETEISKLREKVAEADAKVANFRIDNDLYNGADGTSSLIDQQLSDIATQITQSQERQSTATSRATVLRSMIQQGKPIDSVPALQDSATITQLAEQKSVLQSQKAELSSRLLSNHPTLVAITSQIGEIDKQMTLEGKRIADALEAEADIEKTIEASLRDQLTRLKTTASGDLTNGVTLAELEREAKAQRDLLETYLVRYRDASARTDVNSALPDVRVVTAAAPSVEPASPKTALILIAVAVISLAAQVGQILFAELVSGRAIVEDGEVEPRTAMAEPSADSAVAQTPVAPQEATVPLVDVAAPPQPNPARRAVDFAHRAEPDPNQLALDLAAAPPVSQPVMRLGGYRARPNRPAPVATPRDQGEWGLPASLHPLVDAIVRGKERVVVIAGLGDPAYAADIFESLSTACLRAGLRIATIDAASGRRSANAGLGDLLVGAAGYGDVVHADQAAQMARVPWGRQERLDAQSTHGVTLTEALSDIYNLVLIAAGTSAETNNLGVFSGLDGYLVVASSVHVDAESEADLEADAAELGFSRLQLVSRYESDARVA